MKKLINILGRHSDVIAIVAIVLAVGALNTFWNSRQVGSVNHVVAQQHRVIGRVNRVVVQQRQVIATLSALVGKLQRQVTAECGLNHDLSGLPVAINPITKKGSLLGAKIVSDVRVAFDTARCAGHLPKASPSFVRWADYYKLKIR